MGRSLPIAVVFLMFAPEFLCASPKTEAAKEASEYILEKFGREATEEGLETLTRKTEKLALEYGDDVFPAVKKVGPRAFRIVQEAGKDGLPAVKLMARYGDDAVWVVAKPNRLAMFVRYGDDAAEAMMKHGEIAEPLLEKIGKPAAGALKSISPQNARRLAMMAKDGRLAQIGKTPELLDTVARYGDPAMDFIWRNKGSLTVATGLTAFLANPKPFLDGATDITRIAGENVARPIASVPGQVASEAAKRTNWTIVLLAVVFVVGAVIGFKVWLRNRGNWSHT